VLVVGHTPDLPEPEDVICPVYRQKDKGFAIILEWLMIQVTMKGRQLAVGAKL
jgi:hypothetical protein